MPQTWTLNAARLAAALCLWLMAALPLQAQSIIRDAEIERGLRELAAPILAQAGLPRSIRIIVINDQSLNAFVADARHIFIHSGLLMRMEDPAELQAVLAHEAAHIANGHFATRATNARNAGRGAGFGLLLALAAASAGSGEAAVGLAMGTQSAAQRNYLAHTRAEEAAADQSALRYMIEAGIDPTAMSRVLDLFRGQEALSAGRQDPYIRSHPLTRDRVRAVEAFAIGRGGNVVGAEPTLEASYWFARTTGKLSAFLQNPRQTLRQVRGRDDEISIMRRAIALHRAARSDEALTDMARLLALRPSDPFYTELRAQILFESRDFAAAAQAYGQAVALAPREPQILAGHGRALLALDTSSSNSSALSVLQEAYARDPLDPRMLRDLALAYARGGQNGQASAVTAERYALLRQFDTAAVHARRAIGLLPQGSPGYRRSQDILAAAESGN
ncbi:MAG: M48 family metalloprotease [Pseudomonadota bacterium]